NVYRKLQEHLNKTPTGFPTADSGADTRLLRHIFTPEEAELALYLRFGWDKDLETLEDIYTRMQDKDITLQELEEKLDLMAKKGAINSKRENGKKYYGIAALIVGMYEYQVDKLSKEFLKDLDDYLNEVQYPNTSKLNHQQLRIIPIDIKVEPEHHIAPYDNIRVIIESSKGPFAKINCICRQAHEIEGEPCQMSEHIDNCIGLGSMAQNYITQGWGVEISKKETLQILKRSQEEGLIFRPNNAKKVDFICSCCYCCDGGIAKLVNLPDSANYVLSNYYAGIDPELCIGCGTCVDRCQIKACTLEDNISVINPKKCIGCGNCVISCKSGAITLYKKKEQHTPPETMDDLFNEMLKEKLNKS
ncbi:MAG: 4Fe-4S binding protein, partial [Candidatus Lokiarchaeota archaeon]